MADATNPNQSNAGNLNVGKSTPAHVLVVDDNAMNRDVLGRRLQRNGHTVEAVEGGAQALASLGTGRFDPGPAGPRVSHLPVLMISAIGDTEASCVAWRWAPTITSPSLSIP